MGFGAFGQHSINNQQPPSVAACQRLANIAQNLQRMLVVPIMDDVLQVVSVSTRRDLFEEIAGHWLAAMIHAHVAQHGRGALNDVWQIQQYSLHTRMSPECFTNKVAVSPGYIHQYFDTGEVVGIQHCWRELAANGGHAFVECSLNSWY